MAGYATSGRGWHNPAVARLLRCYERVHAQSIKLVDCLCRVIASIARHDGHGGGLRERCTVVLRPRNRLQTRSCGKQPQEIPSRAMVRARGVHRCVSGHFSGICVEPRDGAGFRQFAGRPPPVGEDLLYARIGWESDGHGSPCCGQTPTAEFAIWALVRPIVFMSSSGLFRSNRKRGCHLAHPSVDEFSRRQRVLVSLNHSAVTQDGTAFDTSGAEASGGACWYAIWKSSSISKCYSVILKLIGRLLSDGSLP